MISMLAILSCVFGGCEAPARLAAGIWTIRVQQGETACEGLLELQQAGAAEVKGDLYLCDGQFGVVTGVLHSNELVLDYVSQGSSGLRMTVRASLVGDYLSGDLADGQVEGWRGEPPQSQPARSSGGSDNEGESDSELAWNVPAEL